MLVDQRTHALPLGQILVRGVMAAHSVLLGALLLFLLHAPAQVLNALMQGLQAEAMAVPGKQPDPTMLLLYMAAACGTLLLAVAVFFLFPLVQGGILGQVRDRLESPLQPPQQFGTYGRANYLRLLGNQGLLTLAMLAIMVPTMCLSVGLAFQEVARVAQDAPQPLDTQQLTRQLLLHPVMLAAMLIATSLAMAVGMVYWVASCIVVAEQERVIASWRKALHFCRENFSAVLTLGVMGLVLGVLSSPLSLASQLGIVRDLWAVVGLALVYSVLVAYSGVLLAGLSMSLYLARRQPSVNGEIPSTEQRS